MLSSSPSKPNEQSKHDSKEHVTCHSDDSQEDIKNVHELDSDDNESSSDYESFSDYESSDTISSDSVCLEKRNLDMVGDLIDEFAGSKRRKERVEEAKEKQMHESEGRVESKRNCEKDGNACRGSKMEGEGLEKGKREESESDCESVADNFETNYKLNTTNQKMSSSDCASSVKKWTDEQLRVLIDSCYKYLQGDPHASREPCLTHLKRIFNGQFNFRQLEGKLSELSALHQRREEEEFYKVQYDKLKHKLGNDEIWKIYLLLVEHKRFGLCSSPLFPFPDPCPFSFQNAIKILDKFDVDKEIYDFAVGVFSDEHVRKAIVSCDLFPDDESKIAYLKSYWKSSQK